MLTKGTRKICSLTKIIIMKVKQLLLKIWAFITGLWSKLDQIVDLYAPIAITVVEELKKINEGFLGNLIEKVITLAIPGKADDAIVAQMREKLKVVLPRVILSLNVSKAIAKIKDPNEQLKAIIAEINMSKDEVRNAYYHILSTMILEALSDGKLTWTESIHISEYYYTNIHKKKAA